MNKIIMLMGLPGAGKTTYAKKWVAEDSKNRVRVNKDDLREEYPKKVEKFIMKKEYELVEWALQKKQDVMIDDTNFNPIHKERYQKLADMYGVSLEVFDLNVDPVTCIERDLKRGEKVGKKAIIDMYKKYIYKDPKGYKITGNTILCDLDGTLAFKHEDRGYYDYEGVSKDYFNGILGTILAIMSQAGYRIVFLSGRKENCRKETEEWLDAKFKGSFMPYTLLMRRSDDDRDDTITKKEIYENNFTKEEIVCVFDDRPKVRIMWLKAGLYVFGCNQEPYDLPF